MQRIGQSGGDRPSCVRRGCSSVACLLMVTGTAWAAQFAQMRARSIAWKRGRRFKMILYVSAGEIFIDGTIEGDPVAAGGYVEVNGVVTGDALVAGASVVINGVVQDDVRAAGAAVDIVGTAIYSQQRAAQQSSTSRSISLADHARCAHCQGCNHRPRRTDRRGQGDNRRSDRSRS